MLVGLEYVGADENIGDVLGHVRAPEVPGVNAHSIAGRIELPRQLEAEVGHRVVVPEARWWFCS